MFEDDLLLEQDQRASLAIPMLPGSLIGGVDEAARTLGVEGLSAAQRATRGFMALLTTLPDGRKQQKSYHIGQLDEVIAAVEKTRAVDTYLGSAIFASARSRRAANVRSLQVAWVDLDCYKLGLSPTPELVERLVDRARFAGIPEPTHIIGSGRGLYLKWLLDAPVADSDLHPWRLLQKGLNALFLDVGSDLAAIDQARVLRVVGSLNSKVNPAVGRDDAARVGVVWDSGRRHRFADLCLVVSQLDLPDALQAKPVARTDRVLHQVKDAAGRLILPPHLQGDLRQLAQYGDSRRPNLQLEARARAQGKSGLSAVTLGWHRFLDLRDLVTMRAEATGGRGIPEGARDLTMLYMVNFLAQARMVRTSTLFQEVAELLPAFDGVGAEGPQGYESPLTSGALGTLAKKMQASERGIRVRFGGSLWDPKYTPSNDYLINLFSITSSEMSKLRTIIDSGEKRCRADKKAPGRSERRALRHDWHAAALNIRSENQQRAAAGEASIATRAVATHIAQAVGATPQMVRSFFRVHDQAAERAAARARGEAPPRAYRRAADLPPEEQAKALARRQKAAHRRWLAELRDQGYDGGDDPASIEAWLDARAVVAQIEMVRQRVDAAQHQEDKIAAHRKRMGEALERIAARLPAASELASTDAASEGLGEGLTRSGVERDGEAGDPGWTRAATLTENILRRIGRLRDDSDQSGFVSKRLIPMTTAALAQQPPPSSTARVSKRELLNRARAAGGKAPLESVGTPDQARALSVDAPVAPPSFQSPGTGPTPVRDSSFSQAPPPDFEMSATSCDVDDHDGEPAGMPDLDDGYLDSFGLPAERASDSRAQVDHVEDVATPRTLPESPAPAAFQANRLSRGPQTRVNELAMRAGAGRTPTSFRAPAQPGVPRAPLKTGFGSLSTAGARGASVRSDKVEVVPSLGFKRTEAAALSPEQARINGQNVDFAKLSDEPRYDAAGVQIGYPTREAWPDDQIPAGSQYSQSEWEAARKPDPDLAQGHIVVEIQVGNPIVAALLRIPRVATPDQATGASASSRAARAVNGKVVQAVRWEGIEDVMAEALADTIVVSRKCPVPAQWRGAVEGGLEHVRGGVSSFFRIIRPRSHYGDPDKLLYINAKLQISGSFAERGATFAGGSDAVSEQRERSESPADVESMPAASEAPRG